MSSLTITNSGTVLNQTEIGLINLRHVSTLAAGINDTADLQRENATLPSSGVTDEDSPLQSRINRKEFVQYATLCFCLFLAGYNDGSTGPLLPTIQRNYHLSFSVVSLLFVCQCIGSLVGSLSNVYLTEKLGFGKTVVIGAVASVIGYSVMATGPPYPLFCISYTINGFGLAVQDAQANGFVASFENATAKMHFMHAIYGLGALISPLISTQFAKMPRWFFQYLTSLGVALANLIFLSWVFKLKTQEAILGRSEEQSLVEIPTSQQSTIRQILCNKTVQLLATFLLMYVGIEVTIGGWIVTFVIDERGGGPNAGYISTGFFGGLTAGRLVLHYATKLIPEHLTILIYSAIAIGLEIIIWRVPSLIGNAICVSFIGFFLGPMYPSIMDHSGKILPRWILTASIGWMAGFGVAGAAFLPFMTGALANRFGITSLQPLLIAAFVIMVGLWALVPRLPRRAD